MKAFVTAIDDNGEVICKDYVLAPTEEKIVSNPDQLPIKETTFNFVIRQLADFQTLREDDECQKELEVWWNTGKAEESEGEQ